MQNLWPTATFNDAVDVIVESARNDAVDVIVESARIMTKTGVVPEGTTQTVRLGFKEVGLPH